jgi:hypothetical protein
MARNSAADFLDCQVPMLFMPDRAYPCDLESLVASMNRDMISMGLR